MRGAGVGSQQAALPSLAFSSSENAEVGAQLCCFSLYIRNPKQDIDTDPQTTHTKFLIKQNF